ncbi:MAG TPA: hypothetical protein VFB87_06940 [Gaiellaceae bacterium]|jgi:hypothetical protein|nr:hypothetical protein [Gaiellaceae bacterium]
MTDQEDRERESRESDITKFEEIRIEEEAERESQSERLKDEQQPEQNEP